MLVGEFHAAATAGGRLTVPRAISDRLGRKLTVTRGIERCLVIYPADEWQRLARKIQSRVPLTSQDGRTFARLIFSGASTCAPDEDGQISLPDHLRRYARIDREVVIVGLGTHLEVWSSERWQAVSHQIAEEASAAAERIVHLGI